jgi:hypothetical protein
VALVDLDDTIRATYGGYAKQGAGRGYTGVKGLNALLVTICTPLSAPVIAATRLRQGATNSVRGAAKLLADALATARRAGATGQVIVRADSAYYCHDIIAAARRAGARFSVTARHTPAVTRAITTIAEHAWVPIHYPNAIRPRQHARRGNQRGQHRQVGGHREILEHQDAEYRRSLPVAEPPKSVRTLEMSPDELIAVTPNIASAASGPQPGVVHLLEHIAAGRSRAGLVAGKRGAMRLGFALLLRFRPSGVASPVKPGNQHRRQRPARCHRRLDGRQLHALGASWMAYLMSYRRSDSLR